MVVADLLLDLDVDSLVDDEDHRAAILGLYALKDRVDAALRRVLARARTRDFWADDGAVSLGNWVEARAGVPRSQVAAAMRLGGSLAELPEVDNAGLSTEQVRLIVGCKPADSEQVSLLVGWAQSMPLADFTQVARSWNTHRDAAGVEPEPPASGGRVYLNEEANGWWHLHGDLAPEQGKLVAAALNAEVDRRLRRRDDGDPTDAGRDMSEIRADALVDLLANTMRREPSAHSVPDRYRVAVVVDSTDPASWLQRVELCDATFYRAVLDAESEVLDIGRTTRRWPEPTRRAITLRDRGCAFPGCDRPPSSCDVHHCREWEHGGETAVDNGLLLCRSHHTFIHRHRWRIRIQNGRRPAFIKPDGTVFQIKEGRTPRSDEDGSNKSPSPLAINHQIRELALR